MGGGDTTLDEKRVYSEKREYSVVYAATEVGLCRVTVSGDQIGRISLAKRGKIRDVAGADGQLLIATPEDVYVGTDQDPEPTEFGPAIAVGVGPNRAFAVGPSGSVAILQGDSWQYLGTVVGAQRFDGAMLATEEGIYRIQNDGLEDMGLKNVHDVAIAGPYATADGTLYRFQNGEWSIVLEDGCCRIAANDKHTHVIGEVGLLEKKDSKWQSCELGLPEDENVADVAYGGSPYAVTVNGTFLVKADRDATPDGSAGWRHQMLGLSGVSALAVP